LLTSYYQESGIVLDYSVSREVLKHLEEEMYIKITPEGAVLREKGWKIFENSSNDRFIQFLNTYPSEVPTEGGGTRATAPTDPDSQWANALRRVWNVKTQNNIELQDRIIKRLFGEVATKEATNNLMYMPRIDRWLDRNTWEFLKDPEDIKPFDKSI
jgi:hypothetical protein